MNQRNTLVNLKTGSTIYVNKIKTCFLGFGLCICKYIGLFSECSELNDKCKILFAGVSCILVEFVFMMNPICN